MNGFLWFPDIGGTIGGFTEMLGSSLWIPRSGKLQENCGNQIFFLTLEVSEGS